MEIKINKKTYWLTIRMKYIGFGWYDNKNCWTCSVYLYKKWLGFHWWIGAERYDELSFGFIYITKVKI